MVRLIETVVIDRLAEQTAAARQSVIDLASLAVKRGPDAFDSLCAELGVSLDDCGDLVRCKAGRFATAGALKLDGFKIEPADRYVELFTALADDTGADAFGFSHGWPVLSVGSRSPTVAEAAGESILGGGGGA